MNDLPIHLDNGWYFAKANRSSAYHLFRPDGVRANSGGFTREYVDSFTENRGR